MVVHHCRVDAGQAVAGWLEKATDRAYLRGVCTSLTGIKELCLLEGGIRRSGRGGNLGFVFRVWEFRVLGFEGVRGLGV